MIPALSGLCSPCSLWRMICIPVLPPEPQVSRSVLPRNCMVTPTGTPGGHSQPPKRGSATPSYIGFRTIYLGAPIAHHRMYPSSPLPGELDPWLYPDGFMSRWLSVPLFRLALAGMTHPGPLVTLMFLSPKDPPLPLYFSHRTSHLPDTHPLTFKALICLSSPAQPHICSFSQGL